MGSNWPMLPLHLMPLPTLQRPTHIHIHKHLSQLVRPMCFHKFHPHTRRFLHPPSSMAAASSSSSFHISNIVKIRQQNHHALPFRLRLPPSFVGASIDSGIRRRASFESQSRPRLGVGVSVRAAGNLATGTSNWDAWKPDLGSKAPSLSDIFWPSAGAFAAMAVLGKMDQVLAKKGVSMTIAPLGAVCAVLFATPSTPGARKYNMFMAQMGCAAIGVLAFSFFGPGWLARSTALSASLAFMIYTRAVHPPAASLPLLFIDGAKFHHLKFWYVLFPGAAGCLLLCLIQEVVGYLKDNVKF